MTSLQKLDAVLLFLEKHHSKGHHNLKSVMIGLTIDNPKIDFGEVKFILNKLEKDGFIDFRDDILSNRDRVYMINFEGRLFNEIGGYARREKHEKSKYLRMNLQNYAIAGGALVAGIYYLSETIRIYILPLLRCH